MYVYIYIYIYIYKRHSEIFSSLNLQGKLHVLVVKLAHMGVIYGTRFY
jgi:hypothetical protein